MDLSPNKSDRQDVPKQKRPNSSSAKPHRKRDYNH